MFKSAKLKLTAWYLIIIMCVTTVFSSVVYYGVVGLTGRALEAQRRRVEHQFREFGDARVFSPFNIETLNEVREKTLITLVIVNSVVLIISGALGYFLAGLTLQPIEEMLNRQKRFISDAAHEMKTPLTAMKTNLEVTLRDKALNLQESKKSIHSVLEEVDNLHKLTDKLLTQSKYQNSIENGVIEEIQLDGLIKKVIDKLKSLADNNDEQIITNLVPVKVRGYKESLETLFTNIIENAIKYNKAHENVEIKLTGGKNFAEIEISDKGIGIDKSEIPNIFEPFYQADKSRTKASTNGYGLGLTIVQEIVEKHKGTIKVESTKNSGTVVTVRIPLLT